MTMDSPQPARALVLGAGYTGDRLARALRARGRTVVATRRSLSTATGDPDLRYEPWDSRNPDAAGRLASWLPEVDEVYVTVAPGRGGAYADVYGRTAHHLAACAPPFPGSVVFVSSTSVYGESSGGWVDEETPPQASGERVADLLDAETRLLRSPLPVRVVRAAGIYGPDRIRLGLSDESPVLRGSGRAWLNLIHVDDLVRILIAASERGRPGRVYHAAGNPVRREAYYARVARNLGLPEPGFEAGPSSGMPGKRIRADRIRTELGVTLAHPDPVSGIEPSVETPDSP